jgi:hypothetical protein
MNSGTRRGRSADRPAVLLSVFVFLLVVAYARTPAAGNAVAPSAPQDLIRVESRLSQLEQRIYSIEASVRGLEQQSRLPSAVAGRPTARDPEVGLLRTELDTLRLRLAEVECGLARVDERTLTPAAREARRKAEAGAAADPCRLNTDAPLSPRARP